MLAAARHTKPRGLVIRARGRLKSGIIDMVTRALSLSIAVHLGWACRPVARSGACSHHGEDNCARNSDGARLSGRLLLAPRGVLLILDTAGAVGQKSYRARPLWRWREAAHNDTRATPPLEACIMLASENNSLPA